jgi:hypothetical protein
MQSHFVADHCIEMQKNIEKGNVELDEVYVNIVKSMLTFLEKVKEMSINISKSINLKNKN